ncbi:MAG: FAD binding domain-containing protein [Spirochaetales bacterium]|nr:FAD binding domain-containing protein [Spirochaetales bacterium]
MINHFYRPGSVDEALSLHSRGGVFLAGGTEINRGRKGDGSLPGIPDRGGEIDAIYLADLGLSGIRKEGGAFFIGACTSLQDIADSPELPAWIRTAAGFIPSRNIRNMATIGGNIGAGRWNSVILPGLLAAGGVLHMAGGKTLAPGSYLESPSEAGLILEIELPDFPGVCRTLKEARSHLAVPVVTAGVYLEIADGKVSKVRIGAGCGCTGSLPGRLTGLEDKLTGEPLPQREALINLIKNEVNPSSDPQGSAEYRKQVNGVKIADLLIECREALV